MATEQELARSDIEQLGLVNPIIYNYMAMVYQGTMTYDQAVMRIIMALHKTNQSLTEKLCDIAMRNPPPTILVPK